MYMKKNSYDFIADLSRLILILLTSTGLYVLYLVFEMRECGELFLRAYNSVPIMLEHVLAGVVVYLAFAAVSAKISCGKNSR